MVSWRRHWWNSAKSTVPESISSGRMLRWAKFTVVISEPLAGKNNIFAALRPASCTWGGMLTVGRNHKREDGKLMAKLQLSFACGLYDRMQPLYTGEVTPDGIDLNFIAIDQPRPIFDRMSGGEEFDVSEYSLSEF